MCDSQGAPRGQPRAKSFGQTRDWSGDTGKISPNTRIPANHPSVFPALVASGACLICPCLAIANHFRLVETQSDCGRSDGGMIRRPIQKACLVAGRVEWAG